MTTYYVAFIDMYTGARHKLYGSQGQPLKRVVLAVAVPVGTAVYEMLSSDDVYTIALDMFMDRYGIDPLSTSCACCAPSDYSVAICSTAERAMVEYRDSLD